MHLIPMDQWPKPYYAVIFTSKRTSLDEGYGEMATKMEELSSRQDGFLGIESARSEIGITVSYWKTLEAIRNWKENSEHTIAQKLGKKMWYEWYHMSICKVERAYEFHLDAENEKRKN